MNQVWNRTISEEIFVQNPHMNKPDQMFIRLGIHECLLLVTYQPFFCTCEAVTEEASV